MEKKKLPIGIEFFEHFKRDNFYYVDKTVDVDDTDFQMAYDMLGRWMEYDLL